MGIYKDRVTIYEVAKAAGVSLATVSRVINKQSNVTQETKERVEETIKRLFIYIICSGCYVFYYRSTIFFKNIKICTSFRYSFYNP